MRAFIAIGVLLGKKHSAWHDFELFFQVLFWIYMHYKRLSKGVGPTEFEYQNYKNIIKLADLKKGKVTNKGDFLKTVEDNFSPYY